MNKKNGVLYNVTSKDLNLLKNDPKKFWEDITKISEMAFSDCKNDLTSIEIPDSVTTIGVGVFGGCENLERVKLSNNLEYIESWTFSYCKKLTSIEIPNSVTSIGRAAFRGCENLERVRLSNNLENIEFGTFSYCKKLTSIEIPDSVKTIGVGVFGGCENLENVKLSNNLKNIENATFSDCESLTSIEIPNSVTTIGAGVFRDCKNLENVKLSNNLKNIGNETFESCKKLTSIEIPDSVTTIGVGVFRDCKNLENVKLSNNLKNIENETFSDCESLTSIEIPNSVTTIGVGVFRDCKNLENVKLSNNLKNIESETFSDCESLTSIEIPDSVTTIGVGVFRDCKNLENVKLSNNLKNIENETFLGCKKLTSIEIPDSVTTIGAGFQWCENLERVKLSNNLKNIGNGIFLGCKSLTSIEIPDGVKNIQFDIFEANLRKNAYLTKDKKIILSEKINEDLEKTAYKVSNIDILLKGYYRDNLVQLNIWKEDKKIKFIPPDYVLTYFPAQEIDKYYINNNFYRWGSLVKTLQFDTLEKNEKQNSLTDLMKIYYAIGGFSDNQGESEKAYEYMLKYVANDKIKSTPKELGEFIHKKFSRIDLKDSYNPTFAKFFMKYYHENPNFMKFILFDEYADYLCMAHNSFNEILKNYPNRVVNGNEIRATLTPQFVAEHSIIVTYDNVKEGNEELANIVGRYGYDKNAFEHIQETYEIAKKIKDKYVITCDKSSTDSCVTFNVLEKNDPLGFVLGDITNCCQHIGGAAESCVDDGYVNPNAGFLVFEEKIKDEQNEEENTSKILGQAYIWYDPQTKTVCYDNIEIPTKILDQLKSGEKNNKDVSYSSMMNALEKSAENIMKSMNKDEIIVEQVTVGKGYNDLGPLLFHHYKTLDGNNLPQHRNYFGYSDAKQVQYIIKTYNEITDKYSDNIKDTINDIDLDLTRLKENSTIL